MKGVSVQLFDDAGVAYASGTNIAVMWFDSELPPDLGAIKGQSAIATTDASGYLSLDLDNVTGLAVGEFGFLVCYRLDGIDHRASLVFCSKMEVTSMTGTTVLGPLTDYVRDPDWPAQVPMVNGVQKFTGLFAVFDHDSNFVALQASGNYTVNWGDGSGDINVNAGVQAERNISYASVGGTIVGTSDAVAVTFTDTGDTVNRTAHGYQNGQRVNFATIVSTTGISTHTTYFVVGRTANTFQVASSFGGSALPLTTDGSGTVYLPQYKVALVTVTPQAGQNLTDFSLQKKHSQAGLSSYSTPWLDIAINGASLSTLAIFNTTFTTYLRHLTEASLGENAVTNFDSMFYSCHLLKRVNLNTSSGTSFSGTFSACQNLRSIPLIDTSQASTLTGLFTGANALQSVPRLDTSSCTAFSNMFEGCYALQTVPLLDTSSGLNFSSMFASCNNLQSVPLLDTSIGTNFSSMFFGCQALQGIPELDTSQGTEFPGMLRQCYGLRRVPLLDTSLGSNFTSMFTACQNLTVVPLLNTASGTTFSSMFSFCQGLQEVPPLNVGGVPASSVFTSMFSNCGSLSRGRLEGTAQNISYLNCKLSAAALDDIYTGLATVVGKTITVTGNYGTTGDTPSIATTKGWTVTG